jgi:hypothetical protein
VANRHIRSGKISNIHFLLLFGEKISILVVEGMMESVIRLIFSAENIRMLVLLVFGFCSYVLIKSQMRGLEYSLGKRIDGVDHKIDCVETSLNKKIDTLDRKIDHIETSLLKAMDEKIANSRDSLYNQLKENDFRHLNDTIGTLTFMLEKNKYLSTEDRNFIDGRLDK